MKKSKNVVSNVLRKYRNYHGYSRRALAEKLNVSTRTIEAYEYGDIVPSYDRIKDIIKKLDIPVLDFFPDIAPSKGYISKMEDKLVKYSKILETKITRN
jgi:transcriptional regulator with XRE-family HTH domain